MLDLIKVASAKEIARVEKITINESDFEFIQKAGASIAEKIIQLSSTKKIFLLLGKGNKAADGLCAACNLIKHGFSIRAIKFFDESLFSKGASHFFKLYEKAGCKIEKQLLIEKDEIVLDAIFGVGFEGELENPIAEALKKINSLPNLKIAIDIPTGLDGSNGKVKTALKADYTFYIELPKTGFFINQGWDHVGKLVKNEIGLPDEVIKMAKPDFFLLQDKIASILPKIKRSRNKYEAFVVGITGSFGMEGAANLSGRAALRAGSGIVKLFLLDYPQEISDELVKIKLDVSKKDEIIALCNSAKAIYIGPGLGRSEEIENLLSFLLPKIEVPLVLDADGLYFFASNLNVKLPNKIIMTPHRKEMLRLLGEKQLYDEELILKTQNFVDRYKTVLVLKGGPTFIFSPKEKPIIVTRGDPGMAKAGTGDVLTGIITALLSQGLDLKEAAIAGVYIHGVAGEEVVKEKTAFSLLASDLIEYLPKVFKNLQEGA